MNPLVDAINAPVAVYVHTPFCPTKCGYCDFNSFAMQGPIVERTVAAIEREILGSPWRGRPAKTVFFGGGTPTFLAEEQLLRLLRAVAEVHPPVEGAEVTSEANPTVDTPKFQAMRQAGFNRISLGAQSFVEDDLIRLGRVHRSGEIERAVRAARDAGFENVNLDLMFALPGQTLAAWRANLDRAIGLEPEHVSLYCLTLEPNTPFYKEHLRGTLVQPGEESQVAMYEEALDRTQASGYGCYEISNFARPGRECEHNLCYWRAEEYAAYGPGAVGRIGMERTTNLKHPERYCTAVETGAELKCERETLDAGALHTERLMLGLRLAEGVSPEGVDPEAVRRLLDRGWVEASNGRVRLTRAGRHFCTEATVELMVGA